MDETNALPPGQQLPKPNQGCLWCRNSHVANANSGCTCPEPCGQGWCVAPDGMADEFEFWL